MIKKKKQKGEKTCLLVLTLTYELTNFKAIF